MCKRKLIVMELAGLKNRVDISYKYIFNKCGIKGKVHNLFAY